uniref:T-cell receptor alpha/delta variable 23.0.2 n=1 Tax=Cyprinus carpio TaxID=7962 RepID=A0A8C1YF47_CYPCA
DSIEPKDKDNIISKEGESVTLSCTYDTSSNNISLYWYRQYPNRIPQFILLKGAQSQSDIPDTRFQSATSQTSTELTINSVTLSDSALYYCALRVGAQ